MSSDAVDRVCQSSGKHRGSKLNSKTKSAVVLSVAESPTTMRRENALAAFKSAGGGERLMSISNMVRRADKQYHWGFLKVCMRMPYDVVP